MNTTTAEISFGASSRSRELKPPFFVDFFLLALTLGLVSLSLIMVYSTTAIMSQERYGDSLMFVKRQAIAACLGFLALYILARTPVTLLRRASAYLYPACLCMIAMTLIPGLGDDAGGAHRWIKVGPIRYEPVELVKVMYVIFLAGFFCRHDSDIGTFSSGVAKPFLLVGILGGLLLMQPDFGSASVLAFVTLVMATAAGARLRFLAMCGAALACCMGVLIFISPYRMGRVVGFLSPFSDASGKGYQLIQSLIAVGSGQVQGVGLGAGQQKLFYLPAAHTDFIFAVIGEELGFLGCLGLMAMFALFLWRGLRLADRLKEDTFAYCLAIGLTSLIVIPALLNMGVVVGLLPTKGMVLPLVGYGGSSMLASLAVVGLILSLARSFYSRML